MIAKTDSTTEEDNANTPSKDKNATAAIVSPKKGTPRPKNKILSNSEKLDIEMKKIIKFMITGDGSNVDESMNNPLKMDKLDTMLKNFRKKNPI